jgi:hypothetical protein
MTKPNHRKNSPHILSHVDKYPVWTGLVVAGRGFPALKTRTISALIPALMVLCFCSGCFSTRPNYEPTFKLLESTLGNLRRDYKRGFVSPTGDPATDHPYRESKIMLIDSALRNISAARGDHDEEK